MQPFVFSGLESKSSTQLSVWDANCGKLNIPLQEVTATPVKLVSRSLGKYQANGPKEFVSTVVENYYQDIIIVRFFRHEEAAFTWSIRVF